MTTMTFRAAACAAALMVAGTPPVFGQAAPPLTTFVNNSATATPLQRTTGIAVQNLCTHLGVQEPTPGFALPAGSPKLDAYLRCNEMVQTARQLNGLSSTRSLNLSADQLLGALQQVSGEELASQSTLTTRVSSGQFANISGRLNALRFGVQSAAARGRTAALAPESQSGVLAYEPDRVVDPKAFGSDPFDGVLLRTSTASDQAPTNPEGTGAPVEPRFGWFTEGSYNFGDHDQTVDEDSFDFDAVSGTIGVDYNLGTVVLGASAGYDRYKADFNTNAVVNGGDVEVKGGSGSLFAAWFGGPITLDAIASYGTLSSDIERHLLIPSNNNACVPVACPAQDRAFTGSPDGHYTSAGVSAGYEMDVAKWRLGFSVAGNYRDVKIDSYTETDSTPNGGLALAYSEQTVESFRSIVGFSASRAFGQSFGILMPTFRAEWHHEFKDDPRTIQAQYAIEPTLTNRVSACVSCFALQTDQPESDFGIAGAGLSLTFARRFQAYLYYEALIGVSDFKSNSVALGFRGQF